MKKIKEVFKRVKQFFTPKQYTVKDIQNLTNSGYQQYINTRFIRRINGIEEDIFNSAKHGGRAVVTTFEDPEIREKQDEFVSYFKDKGYNVKEFNTVVLILWQQVQD